MPRLRFSDFIPVTLNYNSLHNYPVQKLQEKEICSEETSTKIRSFLLLWLPDLHSPSLVFFETWDAYVPREWMSFKKMKSVDQEVLFCILRFIPC
jgi:hypothetical protein